MKNIFIISNEFKDQTFAIAKKLCEVLSNEGCGCEFSGLTAFRSNNADSQGQAKTIPSNVDLCIVLGGDGTLLEAAGFLPHDRIPVFGINIGTLGYLTEVGADAAIPAVLQILSGDYITEERMMIKGLVSKKDEDFVMTAVNDIVLARYGSIDNIQINVRVNESQLCAYRADGVILSTPTGSTADNMSAGGPIAIPTSKLILMTPVAPHNLTSRSIVFSAEDRIELTFLDRSTDKEKTAEVSFDGNKNIQLLPGESLTVTRSERVLKIIRLKNTSFMETLHQKLI